MKSPIDDVLSKEICTMPELDVVNIALNKVETVIKNFLDTKDSFIDNDYIEVIGDAFKVVGIAKKLHSLVSQKKFEYFLNGFKDINIPTEEQLEKLLKYIDNEQKAEFIADTFSKLLLSKSKKACLIMGSLMKKFIDDNHNLTHLDLIYINALPDLFDQDLINFEFICDFINDNSKSRSKYLYCYSKAFREDCNNLNIDLTSINLTLEKCVSLQLLSKSYETEVSDVDTDGNSASAETSEYCNISKPGEIVYAHIKNLIK